MKRTRGIQLWAVMGGFLAAIGGCDDAAAGGTTTTDSTGADTKGTGPAWLDAPTATEQLGQGQTRWFPLALAPGDAVATVSAASGVEATVMPGDTPRLAVHADYAASGPASATVAVGSAGANTPYTLAFDVLPFGWQSPITWSAEGPEAREHGAILHDAAADRVVLIGGSGYKPYLNPLSDVWAFDLETRTWEQLSPTGDLPAGGGSRRVAQIPGSQIAYLFGGYGVQGAGNKDLYRVDFSAKQPVFTKLSFSGGPSARSLHAFAYDAGRDRFVCFGGVDSLPRSDTWMLTIDGDTATWSKLNTAHKPSGRYGFFSAMDHATGRLIVYSGAQGTATIDPAHDTWVLDLSAETPDWEQVTGETDSPPGRRNGCAVWDPAGPRLLVFGGTADAKTSEEGLFAFDARPGHYQWQQLALAGEPAVRSSGFGLYDPLRNKLLLGFGNTSSAVFQDLQVLGY